MLLVEPIGYEDNRQLRAELSIYRLVMKRLDVGVRKRVRKR
jgi:hypothetical protein